MNEIIHIKCPWCSAVLSVPNQPGIESKTVTCPVCKHKTAFSNFIRVENKAEEPTQYPGQAEDTTIYGGEKTDLPNRNLIVGQLKVVGSGQHYQLKPGRNVVGRKATASSADFQIATGESKLLSREHLVVEVKRVAGKGFVHYLSLYKEKVNRTCINNDVLEYGDCVVLKQDDVIHLPGIDVKFELPDGDSTEF
jgi:hypothetical protein